MNSRYSSLLMLFLGLITGCIEPLDLDTANAVERLVVDGLITNEPGPYTVILSKSEPYASYTGGRNAAIRGATVIISDDKGAQETLVETTPGVYKTSAVGIQGQIGNTYTLTIKTKEGKEYSSIPELLAPVPAIDDLCTSVSEQKILNASGNEQTVHNLDVYIDAKDPAENKNYYMWQWEGVYRVDAQPWDHKIKVRGVWVPAPKDCCQYCWITDFTNSINVKDDRFINGQALKSQLVTKVPINDQTFESKYRIEVKQLSISEAAYDYWTTLKTQIANVGNIQDPQPAIIIGNIINNTDQKDKALGFFGASAVVKKDLFIKQEELGFHPGDMVLPDDCRVLNNSTDIMPAYW